MSFTRKVTRRCDVCKRGKAREYYCLSDRNDELRSFQLKKRNQSLGNEPEKGHICSLCVAAISGKI